MLSKLPAEKDRQFFYLRKEKYGIVEMTIHILNK